LSSDFSILFGIGKYCLHAKKESKVAPMLSEAAHHKDIFLA